MASNLIIIILSFMSNFYSNNNLIIFNGKTHARNPRNVCKLNFHRGFTFITNYQRHSLLNLLNDKGKFFLLSRITRETLKLTSRFIINPTKSCSYASAVFTTTACNALAATLMDFASLSRKRYRYILDMIYCLKLLVSILL